MRSMNYLKEQNYQLQKNQERMEQALKEARMPAKMTIEHETE